MANPFIFEPEYQATNEVSVAIFFPAGNPIFQELSPLGRELFLFVCQSLEEDSDTVKLPKEKTANFLSFTEEEMDEALIELNESDIITRKEFSTYYINPFYLYRGDRSKLYR